jgi:predicted Zn-dependent protease
VLEASALDVEALRGLALSEMRLGNLARGLEVMRRVIELEPRHAEALTWMAQMLFDDGRSEEALAFVERARDADPFLPRPWYLLGQILVDLGRDKDAHVAQLRYQEIDAASQSLRSVEGRLRYEPHDVGLLSRLVELHSTVGNVPKTREALARLLRERPEDVGMRIHALDVLEKLGDAEGASTAARALEEVGVDDAQAWKRLEAYYARVRNRVKQVEAGERYKRLKPD